LLLEVCENEEVQYLYDVFGVIADFGDEYGLLGREVGEVHDDTVGFEHDT
jgi:hypothetical protein